MKAQYYTSCSELTMDRFITCSCSGDLMPLVISGKPTPAELLHAWTGIQFEYLDLLKDVIPQFTLSLEKDIHFLTARLQVIPAAVDVLRIKRHEGLIMLLKTTGFNFPFNPNNPEAYESDLKRVLRQSKSFAVELETKRKQLERLLQAGNTPTRDYYEDLMILVSKFMGHQVREAETTVSRFAAMYRRMADQIKKDQENEQRRNFKQRH